jgi:hypothetical protein
MPFCISCGSSYQEGVKFCGNCGAKNGAAQGQVAATVPVSSSARNEEVLWEGKPSGVSDKLKEKAKLNSTSYTITNQRIIVKTGLIGKKIEEIELMSVKDVNVKQSITNRLLGVGSITILSTDKTTPSITLDDIKDPNTVKDVIRNAVREEKAAHNISYREHL